MRTHMQRRAIVGLTLVIIIAALALAACGSGSGGGGTAAGPTAAPVVVAGDPARGEALFTEKGCNACHLTTDQKLIGPGLQGAMDGKGPNGDKLPNGKPITDENVREWIKVGGVGKIGQMPGFPDLTDEQLGDLVAYLKTLK